MVEEPPVKTVFLFITHAPEKVLQTIFSRCQSLRVLPLEKEQVQAVLEEKMGVAPSEAQAKAALSGGSVGVALSMIGDKEEYNRFLDMFADLMRALVGRDLSSALDCGEAIASLESREKQKAFCTFAGECIRKIFMLQQKLPQLAGVPEEEEAFYAEMAQKCGRKFCSKTITNIEKVAYMIDRNVNSKILFCDLVNRMFLSI
jgi:DNA polymerase-3 subunit delta'